MKRRLFLKNGSLGVGALVVVPPFMTGCNQLGHLLDDHALPSPFAKGLASFEVGSELFDLAVSELRLEGNGTLASAEAEDVLLSGITGQIMTGTTIAAEIPAEFSTSSTQLIEGSGELYQSAAELVPIPKGGHQEISRDYALLKVVKSSSILTSAATANRVNGRKITSAENMIASAEIVYEALQGNDPAEDSSELQQGSESLLAYSEEYVGFAETFSAEQGIIRGVHTYGEAAEEFVEGLPMGHVAENLMNSSDNLALSTEYYTGGIVNLNAEAEIFNAPTESAASDLIPWANNLVAEAGVFAAHAEGQSAELGAAEMIAGAEEILADAESNIEDIYKGGEKLEIGAEHFIAGTLSFTAAESYITNAGRYLVAAEALRRRPTTTAENRLFDASELLHSASEDFQTGAEALEFISTEFSYPEALEGIVNLVPAASEKYEGAQLLESIANSRQSRNGAAESIQGAILAEQGAHEVLNSPGSLLVEGSEQVEIGAFGVMTGAEEFIEGYN